MSEFFTFKKKPPRKPRISDENNLYGNGWAAHHTAGRYTLGWDGGDLVTKMIEVEISKEEFERLRTEPDSFPEIRFEHDPNR